MGFPIGDGHGAGGEEGSGACLKTDQHGKLGETLGGWNTDQFL